MQDPHDYDEDATDGEDNIIIDKDVDGQHDLNILNAAKGVTV